METLNQKINFSPLQYELKFRLRDVDLSEFKDLLKNFFSQCEQYPFGSVHSLYFDDLKYTSMSECDSGDEFKEKCRLRFYNKKKKSEISFFEIKKKIGKQRLKHRQKYHLENLDTVDFRNKREKPPFYFKRLLPVLEISYNRNRYISHSSLIRLNIDSNLSIDWSQDGKHLHEEILIPKDYYIIELKVDDKVYLKEISPLMDYLEETSHSKYNYSLNHINKTFK